MFFFIKLVMGLFFFFLLIMGGVSPLSSMSLLWKAQVARIFRNYLSLSIRRPVSSFFAPYVFFIIFFFEIMGVLPYGFVYLGDFWIVFYLSFMLWFASILYLISSKRLFVSLWKPDLGFFLASFFFFVEMVTVFIKPMTLMVRLYLNVMFGHYLLMTSFMLLGSSVYMLFWLVFPVLLYEGLVFLVQAYVFTFLIFLYFEE